MILLLQDGNKVYAISAVAICFVLCDEIIIGVGKVYSIPSLAPQAIETGIISSDYIAIREKQGNAWLSAMDDGVVGNRAAFNIVELYSIKSVSDHKAGEAYIICLNAHTGVPAPSSDQSAASKQAEALLYRYLVVDTF